MSRGTFISDIHRDLRIDEVASGIKRCSTKHETRLLQQVNVEATELLNNDNLSRRPNRNKPFKLVPSIVCDGVIA